MVILMGIPSEPPLRLLSEACAARGIACTVFNQRRQHDWRVEYDACDPAASAMDNGDARLRLAECAGLYLRTMEPTRVPEWATSPDGERTQAMYLKLWQLLDDEAAPLCIVNAPHVQMSNNSKPWQALAIRAHGLDIPETCISSDEATVREFLGRHDAVVYKSISGTRSIVKRVDAKALEGLPRIRYCPVQFQECVTGVNVRVHVVGRQVFPTRIRSDAVDYRYATQEGKSTSLEACELPDDVAQRCIELAHALHLPFAGIDLMLADDGRTICFEVNPSPGYSYYEHHTGQRISQALADYLAGGGRA
jgi:glutathione synthase/RimK-type ligase-like ATP-grasp enzyme